PSRCSAWRGGIFTTKTRKTPRDRETPRRLIGEGSGRASKPRAEARLGMVRCRARVAGRRRRGDTGWFTGLVLVAALPALLGFPGSWCPGVLVVGLRLPGAQGGFGPAVGDRGG